MEAGADSSRKPCKNISFVSGADLQRIAWLGTREPTFVGKRLSPRNDQIVVGGYPASVLETRGEKRYGTSPLSCEGE